MLKRLNSIKIEQQNNGVNNGNVGSWYGESKLII